MGRIELPDKIRDEDIHVPPPKCGYAVTTGLWAPLICGREEGHSGTHIDFRANLSIGFGFDA